MRAAVIQDAWRGWRKSSKRVVVGIQISWSGIARLPDGHTAFSKPITLLCGENGAGKSTLLHALYHGLTSGGRTTIGNHTRPHGGTIDSLQVSIRRDDATSTLTDTGIEEFLFPDGEAPRLTLIDSGMHVPAMLNTIRDDPNFNEHLDGITARAFDQTELAQASFIIGKNYASVGVFELESSDFDEVFPYFTVEVDDATYSSSDMGDGELATLYFLWQLSRAPEGSILLVEEPESFLSPRAQLALIDVLAWRCVRRHHTVVMTSHSGAVATRLQNDEIAYVTRSRSTVVLQSPAKTSDLVGRLGLRQDRVFVCFVEDEAGEIFARTLVDRISARLSGQVEYVVKGGRIEGSRCA